MNNKHINTLSEIIVDLQSTNRWSIEKQEAIDKSIELLSKKVDPEDLNFE